MSGTLASMNQQSFESFRMFRLDSRAHQMIADGDDVILLTLGKSDLPLHHGIVDEIAAVTRDPSRSGLVVPGGINELRESLAARYSTIAGAKVETERLLVDAGTSSLFPKILAVLDATGRRVLMPKPYYPLYRVAAALVGAKVDYYEIDPVTMLVDLDSVAANMSSETRVLILNSPGNPLGNVIKQSGLLQILKVLPHRVSVLFDEIYENVIFEDTPSLAPILLDGSSICPSRVVLTNSCSKAYRMYTKRIGWCVAPRHLSGELLAILEHTTLTVNPAVQYGAVEALRLGQEVAIVRERHANRWRYIATRFSDVSTVRLLPCGGGFYCCLDCADFAKQKGFADGSLLALDVLRAAKVATVPGEDFGVPGALRLSFTSDRFESGVDRLATYFSQI